MQKVREAFGGSQRIFGEPWGVVVKRKIRRIRRGETEQQIRM
jgi:hypothetical protein